MAHIGLIVWGATAAAAPPPMGIAPVLYPAGGFQIDGDLIANTPTAGIGDWVLGTNAGSGGAVLTAAGVPLDPTRTFHFTDLYGSASDNTFSGGKWTDNPTNWQWSLGKANGKTDINNVLLHTSTDADGHSWVIIAADRLSTSGASYNDFEFLQNTLVANANGTFSSAGPNGGRTVNDLLLNIAFTSGGSVADFFAWRWMTNSTSGGFTYFDVTASFPTGRVFVAASGASVSVPFGAFGNTTYATDQFAEAAVDLTALLGNFDPCLSIGFATIMVKTKDSPSSSATMSDFINPIKYSLKIGPSANAGPDQTLCNQGDSTPFALNAQATSGLQPIVSTNWSVVSGSATIDDPTSLTTTAHVSSATATLRLTVIQTNGCTETDDIVLNVAPLPACAIAGPALVCPRSSTQFRAPSGMGAYSWTVSGNGSITGATNAQTVTITAGALCGTNFTLQLTVTSNSCVSSCSTDVLVNGAVPPVITSIPTNVTVQCASAVPAANNGAVTATDNCGGTLVVTHSDQTISGNCANNFVIQRTYTVTDSCGNSTNAVQTITVNDNTAPVISSIPTNVTVQCASAVPVPNDGAVVASDNCGGAPVITHSDQITPGACVNKFVVMRTYTATDICGNSSSRTQTITVNDTNAPVIASIPADVTVQCAGNVPAADDTAVVATDNCGGTPVIAHSDQTTPGACINKFVVKRTYTATDECGNSTSRIQTITVSDTNAPVISSIPADVTVSCASAVPPADHNTVVATDNCGGIPVITHSDQTNAGACVNKFVVKRTYTATDECGNRSSQIQTITVSDTTGPTITSIPADVTIQCASAVPAANDAAVVASDACGGTPVISHSDQTIPGTCANKYVVKRTYKATDACGNSSSLVQTITVNDNTAPLISSIPVDTTVQCASAVPAPNDGGVAATDNCGGAPVITHSDQTIPGTCANKYVIQRTYTATDACGNSRSQVQTITINDTNAPVISSIPTNVAVQCASAVPAPNDAGVVSTDNCGGAPVISHFDQTVPGTCINKLVVLRTYTATDICGNSSSRTQTITVNDTNLPVITSIPTNVTVQCASAVPAPNDAAVVATDACGATPVITHSEQIVPGACANKFVVKRTYTATDGCGNSSSMIQTITVSDTTAPVITSIPADTTVLCASSVPAPNDGAVASTDACGGTPVITHSDQTNAGACVNKFVVKRTYTATDACGNSSSQIQTITVNDTNGPVISSIPADVTVQCASAVPAPNDSAVVATDACGGAPAITHSDQTIAGTCANKYVVKRTYKATDACGNSSSLIQTITISDTTGPAITSIPADVTVPCATAIPAANDSVVVATDNCGAAPVIAHSDQTIPGICPNKFVVKRTYTATDNCGNSSSQIQTITVNDNISPSLTIPGDVTLECPANTGTNNTGVATAQDSCSAVTVSYSDIVSNVCGGAKVISRVWTATDACGNATNRIQTITLRDTTRPTITVPPNLTLECGASTAPSATGTATGQDTCSSVTISYSDSVSNICGNSRIISRAWTATDGCGNSASGLQTITVRDTTPPSLRLPADIVLQCPGDTRTNVTGVPTVSDCSPFTVTYSDVISNGCAATKTVWRTWSAVDSCGNATNGLQTISVIDTTKPTIICPRISVQCVADIPPAYPDLTTFLASGGTATDSCSSNLVFSQTSDSGLVGKCPGSVTRVYRVTDACGNFNECTQIITVDDTIPPVLTCPTNVIVECGDSLDPAILGTATAIDNCSTNVSIAYSDALVQSIYNYNINFYAADPAYSPGPNQPPYARLAPSSLPCPVSDSLPGRAADPLRNAVAFGPTSNQLAALTSLGGVPMAFGQVVPYEAVIGVSGNQGAGHGTVEFTIDWSTYTTSNDRFGFDTNYMVYCAFVDTADPGTINPNHYAKLDSYSSHLVNAGTVSEAIEGTFQVSGLDVGDRVVVEIWLVMMSTQPAHVGGTIASQIVSAQALDPNPQPVSTGSKTISLGNLNKMVPLPTPSGQSGPPPPPVPPPVPSVTVSAVDRTWTATDDCGNVSTCVQHIKVRDTAPPVLTAPPDVVLDCPATDTSTNVTGMAVAQDACGSVVALTFSDIVSNGCGGSMVISRAWTATDNSGNSTNMVQTITVRNPAPTLTCPPDLVLECPADTSTNAAGAATAQDACSSVVVSYSDSVSNLCGGGAITFRTWTATDQCGNSASRVQKITVQDTTRPTLTCPPDLVLDCPANTSTNNTGVAVAQDSCSQVTIRFSDVTTTTCGRTIARTWTATDACGNSASCVQTITVVDTTRPTIVCPPNRLLKCPADTSTSNTGVAVASDACSQVSVSFVDTVSNICPGSMEIYRTWTARNACGNSASCVQTISVLDTKPPTLTCATNRTVNATDLWSFDAPAASDTCSAVTVRVLNTVTNRIDANTLAATRTWSATDGCGNSNTCQQTITILSGNPPVIAVMPAWERVAVSNDLTLSASATGSGPMTYQWLVGGVPIPGATSSTCLVHAALFTNAGIYTVQVSNAAGVGVSSPCVVDVAPKLFSGNDTNGMELTWPGPFVLQSAPAVEGPYADVPGAVSPFHPKHSVVGQKFFRLRSVPLNFAGSYLPGGAFAVSGAGVPGCNFILQGSSDLKTWVNIQTNPSPVMLVDSNAWQFPGRFYRVLPAATLLAPLSPPSLGALLPRSIPDVDDTEFLPSVVETATSGRWHAGPSLQAGLNLQRLRFTSEAIFSDPIAGIEYLDRLSELNDWSAGTIIASNSSSFPQP